MENNDLQIFNNKEFGTIRAINIDGQPYFVGKDVAIILGYAKPLNALAAHVDEDDSLKQGVTDSIGRTQKTILINESGLYSLILSSKLPSAKKFKHWVTKDVLPTIRKYGLYATEELLLNPDMMIAAMEALKAEREKNALLESKVNMQQEQIAELKPKATYYDLVLNCKDLLPISVIAKDYGWSAIKMNNYLKSKGVQYKQGKTWLLYQKHANNGYTHSKAFACLFNGLVVPLDNIEEDQEGFVKNISVQTCWTQAGRLFIYELMKADGYLPLIETEINAA